MGLTGQCGGRVVARGVYIYGMAGASRNAAHGPENGALAAVLDHRPVIHPQTLEPAFPAMTLAIRWANLGDLVLRCLSKVCVSLPRVERL